MADVIDLDSRRRPLTGREIGRMAAEAAGEVIREHLPDLAVDDPWRPRLELALADCLPRSGPSGW